MSAKSPFIDSEAIENLRSLDPDGGEGFLREIIGIYLEDVPLRIGEIKTSREAGDRSLLVRSAHTIKGSSANVGAIEVKELAARLEQRAKTEDMSGLGELVSEVEAAFGRAKAALQVYL